MQGKYENCFADNVCAASSPNFLLSGGPVTQCNTDDQCPTYSPSVGTAPTVFCCSEVTAFFNYWCFGINQTLLNATRANCKPEPHCVSQNFGFLTNPVNDSCYFGSNATGGSVALAGG